jgi:radical SAM superfamily enzyme YgiQ (UPF0313 family)
MVKTRALVRSRDDVTRTLLLVVPPQRGLLEGFSTGLIAIANYVHQHDPAINVRLLDFGLLNAGDLAEHVSEALLAAEGRVFVGITGTTASYQSMLATARAFKRVQRSCVVVLGGHHVTPQDDIVLRHHRDIVDFVIRGEGEIALTRLLDCSANVDDVPNLSFLEKGELRRNSDGPLLGEADLDRLSPGFDQEGLRSAAGKFDHVTYVSARGCPLSCAFCVVRATAIRAKSIEGVVRDLRYLVGTLGYTDLAIEDNFFGHQPKRTLSLCAAIEALRKEMPFNWDCQTRVESMRRADVVHAMVRAGCTAAYLGVESLVPKHLHYLGKTPKPDWYLEALETTVVPTMLDAGMDAYLNLQLGLPGETVSDWALTTSTLARLGGLARARGREITVFPQLNVIYPGTPHFDMALQKGYFGPLGRDVFEHFTAWEAEEEPILHYLGEHFAHGVGGIPLGILDGAELTAGRFSVSATALSTFSTQLRRMDSITGVRVFRYGQYLTQQQPSMRVHA